MQKQNNLIILLSILLLISCVIAGLFAYQTQQLVNELRVTRDRLKQTPTSSPNPVADWETKIENGLTAFYDYKYNFKVLFPKSWIFESPAYGGKYLSGGSSLGNAYFILGLSESDPDGDYQVLISLVNSNLTSFLAAPYYGTWTETVRNEITKTFDVTINNYKAHKIKFENGTTKTCFDAENKSKLICIEGPTKYSDQILSTFKFLD